VIIFCDFRKKESKEKLFKYLKTLENVYKLEIKRDKDKRSYSQNRYYHGVVVKMLGDELGNFPTEMHEILKSLFLQYDAVIGKTGEVVRVVKSTTELTTIEFEEYLEKCRIFALTNLGIRIPLPNECIEL